MGSAAIFTGQHLHIGSVNIIILQRLLHQLTINIITNAAHHLNLCTQSSSGYSLIGALATRVYSEAITKYGLAGLRPAVALHCDIDITATNYHNFYHNALPKSS